MKKTLRSQLLVAVSLCAMCAPSIGADDVTSDERQKSHCFEILVPEELLKIPPATDAENQLQLITKAIKYYYEPQYRGNIEKREKNNNRDINVYVTNMLTNGWNARDSVLAYLRTLYKQLEALIPYILQYQRLVSTQQLRIQSLENENLELREKFYKTGESENKDQHEIQNGADNHEPKNTQKSEGSEDKNSALDSRISRLELEIETLKKENEKLKKQNPELQGNLEARKQKESSFSLWYWLNYLLNWNRK